MTPPASPWPAWLKTPQRRIPSYSSALALGETTGKTPTWTFWSSVAREPPARDRE